MEAIIEVSKASESWTCMESVMVEMRVMSSASWVGVRRALSACEGVGAWGA